MCSHWSWGFLTVDAPSGAGGHAGDLPLLNWFEFAHQRVGDLTGDSRRLRGQLNAIYGEQGAAHAADLSSG